MEDILIQGIGFIALGLFVLSYQVKSNKGLFALQLTGNLMFAFQFVLLGGVGGAVGSLISSFRNVVLIGRGKYNIFQWKLWPVLICAAALWSCITSWNSIFSLLPFISVLSSTICYWTENALKIRMGNLLVASPSWLIYDIWIHSLGGILNEVFVITSILVSIYRFGFQAMGNNQFESKN